MYILHNSLKKLFSIALLFVFLFNVMGYYVVYLGWLYQARIETAQQLDQENYNAAETITLKLPFNLPYQEESKEFKRVDGQVAYGGDFYKLVKQKIEHDTLYVVCIKDSREKRIFNFMADMVKLSTDLPGTSPNMKLLNSLTKDYTASISLIIISQEGWSSDNTFVEQPFNLRIANSLIFNPPPEILS